LIFKGIAPVKLVNSFFLSPRTGVIGVDVSLYELWLAAPSFSNGLFAEFWDTKLLFDSYDFSSMISCYKRKLTFFASNPINFFTISLFSKNCIFSKGIPLHNKI
jgi:hypothetical protein